MDWLRIDDQLPQVELFEVAAGSTERGSVVGFRDALGGSAVVFFFTTQCPYCARSRPNVIALSLELEADDVTVLAIALDGQADRYVQAATWAQGLRVLVPGDVRAAAQFRVPRVPTTALVDQKGTVQYLWIGELESDRLAEIVNAVESMLDGE